MDSDAKNKDDVPPTPNVELKEEIGGDNYPTLPNSPQGKITIAVENRGNTDGSAEVDTPEQLKELLSQSKFKTDWQDPEKVNEVLQYMKAEMRFAEDLVDEEWVKIFLRKRWINRHRYTICGNADIFTAEEMSELLPDPVALIKAINDRALVEYRPLVCSLIENMDIYKLPCLNLQLMDSLDDQLLDGMEGLGTSRLSGYLDNVKSGVMDAASKTASAGLGAVSVVGVDMDAVAGLGFKLTADRKKQIREVFDEMDTNGNGVLEIEEWLSAAKKLKDRGFNIDLDGDGAIIEEAQALFYIMDTSHDDKVNYDEFQRFILNVERGDFKDWNIDDTLNPKGSVFAVWDDNTTFIMVYVLFAMSLITQFFVPLNIMSLFSTGMLGDMGDMCDSYPNDSCEWQVNEASTTVPRGLVERTDKGMETLGQFVLNEDGLAGKGALYGMCPAMFMKNLAVSTGGTLAAWWLPRLGASFLFIFLQVSTPIGDAYEACASDTMPDDYDTLKYSYMCQDIWLYRVSFTINLFCYAVIMITTYLLFITGPTADNLLLNSIALQFLIEVDDMCYQAVMTEGNRDRLVQKMLLSYIQNGEKPSTIVDDNGDGMGGNFKDVLDVVLGTYVGYFAALCYWVIFIMPAVIYVCII